MRNQLSEIAEIRSGLHFRDKVESDPNGNVALVQIRDLDEEFVVHPDKLQRVSIEKPEAYLVGQGDVLFSARGARLGASEIRQPLKNTIVTGSFFVLRLREESEVLPSYLTWAINSPAAQTQLQKSGQGSDLRMLRRLDLEGLMLEIPPLETQRAIVALDECARNERHLMKELTAKRSTLIQAVALRAASTPATPTANPEPKKRAKTKRNKP